MEDIGCQICFKIICRQCQWEPTDEEVLAIQKGELTACPKCGWVPGTPIQDS